MTMIKNRISMKGRRWAAVGWVSIPIIVAFMYSTSASAVTTTYNDRTTFEATLNTMVTDDYSSAGYDVNNDVNSIDILSDAEMSAVCGETDYTATGFSNINIISNQAQDPKYCAGCNGSFLLGFTTTSVGNGTGVFGVGFEYFNTSANELYHAFVTFGDSSTVDLGLDQVTSSTSGLNTFFGITSDLLISSIHLGFANGVTTTAGSFGIDNLTIGSGSEPLPVLVDIKPGSLPNSVNLKSNGVLPVAILGTDVFDVSEVDITTLMFGDPNSGTPLFPVRSAIEDVNVDGFDDLSLKFSVADLVESGALGFDTIEGLLTGELFDGTSFEGMDSIRIVPPSFSSAPLIAAVPEPTTSALALAALCLAMSRRRSF